MKPRPEPNPPKFSSSTTLEMLGGLWLRDKLNRIEHKLDKISTFLEGTLMPTLQERFDNVNAQLQEASDEIIAELNKLRELTLPPEAEASLQAIEAKANALKDVSPPIP